MKYEHAWGWVLLLQSICILIEALIPSSRGRFPLGGSHLFQVGLLFVAVDVVVRCAELMVGWVG